MTKPVEKREFWIYKEGPNLLAYTSPSNLFPDNEIRTISMEWHEQEMARLKADNNALCSALDLVKLNKKEITKDWDRINKSLHYAELQITTLSQQLSRAVEGLKKYEFKLENSGAYLVEDHFEEPWHCELLRYVKEALADIERIGAEK